MFKAIKTQEEIRLIGVIHDSTNTSVVIDLISGPDQIISFERVDFFSWNGILNLISDIQKANHSVIFSGFDPRQEEYVKIALKGQSGFQFREYKKLWYDVQNQGQRVFTVSRKRSDTNQKTLSYHDHNFKLADFSEFILHSEQHLDQKKELFLWCFYSFCYFNCMNTSILVKSIFIGLKTKMSEIKGAIKGVETFCEKYQLQGFDIETAYNELIKLSDISSMRLEESLHEVNHKLMTIRILLFDVLTGKKSFKDYQSIIEKRTFRVLRTLNVKVRLLESSGGTISRALYNLDISGKANKIFEDVQSGPEDHEKIEELKDALSIMDIMSEGDWQASLEVVKEEFNHLGNEVFNIIVLLQGFDISHQIIRNRIKDLNLFMEKTLRVESEREIDISDLVSKVNKRMVSDPEMTSFEYFLSLFHDEEEGKSMDIVPGSLQLF